jgi:hypothetical protein
MASSLPVSAPVANTVSVAPTPFAVRCPEGVIAGSLIDARKRTEMFGGVSGGSGSMSPEKYQRSIVEEGTGLPCPKTTVRIDLRNGTLKEFTSPPAQKKKQVGIDPSTGPSKEYLGKFEKAKHGFFYSEDFDGRQIINGNEVLVNFKSCAGEGGSQTRTLREVFWFVKGQLEVLTTVKESTVYFANILDSKECHAAIPQYLQLADQPIYAHVRNRIYIGDLKGYFEWVAKTFSI